MGSVLLLVILVTIFCGLVIAVAFRSSYLFQKLHSFIPDLSLLLIVRNQAPIIEGAIKELLSYYQSSRRSFELVVYDDASIDETPEILRRLFRKHNFTLLFGQEFRSSNDALDAGFQVCQGKVVHYYLLTERVGLGTVISLARCLSRGEKIPKFGIACTPAVMSGTTLQSSKEKNPSFVGTLV